MRNPWKIIKKNYIYENRFGYKLRDDDVITPSGKPGKYMVLEGMGYVVIVAVDKARNLLLTHQWRYPIEEESLELPAGSLDGAEDPLTAAKRELKEEVGGESNDWTSLGWHWLGNGAMKIKGHIFLARDVQLSTTGHEETEKIEIETWDITKVLDMIKTSQITDYRTKLGVLLAKDYLTNSGK